MTSRVYFVPSCALLFLIPQNRTRFPSPNYKDTNVEDRITKHTLRHVRGAVVGQD
jgi:hypothetical protein